MKRLCLALLVALPMGCGEGGYRPPPPAAEADAAVVVPRCIDGDGDGFGRDCEVGGDCDDTDPTIHEGCRTCGATPETGCPCADGTAPAECHSGQPELDEHGRLRCWVGERTCDDGVWGECVFEESFAVDGPGGSDMRTVNTGVIPCGNCDPQCWMGGGDFEATDLNVDNSLGVVWDPDEGGVVIDGQATAGGEYAYIANPADGNGTVSKIRMSDGAEVGRYRVGENHINSPSRTTIDGDSNAYVANRAHTPAADWGSVTKIAGPEFFCQDRNGNGNIDTSTSSVAMAWNTDDCVLWTKRLGANKNSIPRALAIDRGDGADASEGFIWVGTYFDQDNLANTGGRAYQLHPDDGSILQTIALPIRPYGAVADNRDPQKIWFTTNVPGGGLVSVDVETGALGGPYRPNLPRRNIAGGGTVWPDAYGITFDGTRIWQAGRDPGTSPTESRGFDIETLSWCIVRSPVAQDRLVGIAVRLNEDASTTVYAAHRWPSTLIYWDPTVPCNSVATAGRYCTSWTATGCSASANQTRNENWYPFDQVQTVVLGAAYDGAKGVGIDTDGRVWTINEDSENIAVYQPDDGSVVEYPTTPTDLVNPYTYSDFTGYQRAVFTNAEGRFWLDFGVTEPVCPVAQDVTWTDLEWDATVPAGSRIVFEVRTSGDPDSLPFVTPVVVGEAPTNASPIYVEDALTAAGEFSHHRYLRVTAVLVSDDLQTSPVLRDLSMSWLCTDRT